MNRNYQQEDQPSGNYIENAIKTVLYNDLYKEND